MERKIIKATIMLTLSLILGWCVTRRYCPALKDDTPPAPPRGLYSVTGDRKVYLYWLPNTEKDLAGYIVWRGFSYEGPYNEIESLPPNKTSFIDYNVQNGITYYYAVSAYDTAGNESDLSPEEVFDTPRPDGEDIVLSYLINPNFSGFDFAHQTVCSYLSPNCDFYFKYDTSDGIGYILVPDTLTFVQDMGYANSFDEISYAPLEGWSKLGVLEAIEGHIYVFWTRYNHFAKIRILKILNNSMYFEWAYQLDKGNPELSIPSKGLKSLETK
ncbi:MAG: fibronectin type III domain-containing protein [Candidatus Hydrothermales bacterium]